MRREMSYALCMTHCAIMHPTLAPLLHTYGTICYLRAMKPEAY